jgi:hypothetical protein
MDLEALKGYKKDYERLRKKYKLPKFDDLDKEFEIRKIDLDSFPLREIRRNMTDVLQAFASTISSIISPQPGALHHLISAGAFSEEEKTHLYDLYRKLGFYISKCIVSRYLGEKHEAEAIKEIWKKYPSFKKELIKVWEKIIDAWGKKHKPLPRTEYLR